MEILNYALTAIVASIGLMCGAIIARFAKEEIKPGKKYFILLQKLLFVAVIALVMYANRTNVHFIWVGGVIIFVYLYFFNKIRQAFAYGALALAFFNASDMFLPASALIFLYGFPTAAKMKKREIAECMITFLAISIILFFLM